MNHVLAAFALSLVLGLAACSGAQMSQEPSSDEIDDPYSGRQVILGEEGRVTLLQLYADDFEALPLSDRILAYHLYQASVAGRDIAWDQTHRHSLAIRGLMDAILTHPRGIAEDSLARFRHGRETLFQ